MDYRAKRKHYVKKFNSGDVATIGVVWQALHDYLDPNQKTGRQQLLDIMERDAASTGNFLKVANDYSGKNFNSLDEAVKILGTQKLEEVAAIMVTKNLVDKDTKVGDFSTFDLYKHSLATAYMNQIIASEMKIDTKQAFTMGLMHDIGLFVMNQHLNKRIFAHIISQTEHKSYPRFHLAEDEIINGNHAEIGADLLSEWKFPDALCEAVRYHHSYESEIRDVDPESKLLIHLTRYSQYLGYTMREAWTELELGFSELNTNTFKGELECSLQLKQDYGMRDDMDRNASHKIHDLIFHLSEVNWYL